MKKAEKREKQEWEKAYDEAMEQYRKDFGKYSAEKGKILRLSETTNAN